jgi:hypothetical protein
MSFKGMGKSIRMSMAPTQTPTPAPRSDEFPAGYSLTRCSPALASALPADIDHAATLAQLRDTEQDCFLYENRLQTQKRSTQGWVNDHENPWVNDCENPQWLKAFDSSGESGPDFSPNPPNLLPDRVESLRHGPTRVHRDEHVSIQTNTCSSRPTRVHRDEHVSIQANTCSSRPTRVHRNEHVSIQANT